MSDANYDHQEAERQLEHLLLLQEKLDSEPLGVLDELRARLQGLALMDGLPKGVSQAAMAAARALKDVPAEEEPGEALLELIDGALQGVQSGLGLTDEGGIAPEQPIEDDSSVPKAIGTGDDSGTPEVATPGASADAAAVGGDDPVVFMDGSEDPLLDEFLSESLEHLEAAEVRLLELEEAADDPDALNAVFRSFHTVKGGAGILDLDLLSRFAHVAESVLDLARTGAIRLQGHPIDLCYKAVDILKCMLDGLGSGSERFPLPPEYPTVLEQLEEIANAGETIPGVEALQEAKAAASAEPDEEPQTAPPQDQSSSEPKTESAPAREVLAKREIEARGSGTRPQTTAPKRKQGGGSVKIATDRLDNLINLVGELVISTAMVQQEVSQLSGSQPRSLSQLGKVTTELQHIAMSMRMVPLKATFQKAARLVRDVALKCGKRVRFETGGEDTELDRNVVESLGDPLIHMLRNAVDHGVETPERRLEAGKSEVGTIRLEAYHESGSVVIVLSDDGAGMNRGRILEKAMNNGLLTQAQADSMPDSEVWQLIFHPGLSTAKEVSAVSGRGVGMDVVRKNIEALRGSVDIQSTEGKGSRVLIRLPLTLAIIDAMVVVVGSRSYILPTLTIQNFLRPSADAIFSVQDKGEVLSVRERLFPIYRLSELLGIDNAVQDPTQGLLAITSADGHDFALLVDDLRGQQQVVIKSMGDADRGCGGVSGAAILGDGTVGLILDPSGLARLALKQKDHSHFANLEGSRSS